MEDEQQIRHRASMLRAMRAYLNFEQEAAAAGAGVAATTLLAAEKERRCSDKTWVALRSYYLSQGCPFGGDDAIDLVDVRLKLRAAIDALDRIGGDAV